MARPVDCAQVVVGEVDGVELVELRKSLLWNVLNPIVTHIQNLDPSLVCHGHLVLGQVMLTIQCGLLLYLSDFTLWSKRVRRRLLCGASLALVNRGHKFKKVVQLRSVFNRFWSKGN